MAPLESNVNDIALIFEGGGMRASYTSGAVNTLLENGIYFNDVYGVSAGSSNAVNYLSRDIARTRASFTDLAGDPRFGGIGTFLTRRGLFSARYIYQETCKPGCALPFDFETFRQNPANIAIEGFGRDSGESLYWRNGDLGTLDELMLRVRASSTLPLVMPPPDVDGQACYDGGLGEGAGIMLPCAKEDGFERFFVVLTRPRGYRKQEGNNALFDAFFARRPYVKAALARRAHVYNGVLDELERLEAEGRAYLFYAEGQEVESGERDVPKLRANYERGYAQAQRELGRWEAFLKG